VQQQHERSVALDGDVEADVARVDQAVLERCPRHVEPVELVAVLSPSGEDVRFRPVADG
jgi:hypothetical protein